VVVDARAAAAASATDERALEPGGISLWSLRGDGFGLVALECEGIDGSALRFGDEVGAGDAGGVALDVHGLGPMREYSELV
jgi:hypothetical protein